VVRGRVQGVGFRAYAQSAARALGLAGYTRNLNDGSVEVVAAGPASDVNDLLGRLQRGPRLAEVRGIEQEEAPMPQYGSFDIR
jgi:acylphosphatase